MLLNWPGPRDIICPSHQELHWSQILLSSSCVQIQANCGQWVSLKQNCHTKCNKIVFHSFPVQHSLWITVCLMGMEIALGKYVTVMCSDFKEDDTRLYCPVTTGFIQLSSVTAGCRWNKTTENKQFLKYENKASGPAGVEHYTLLFRCRVHVLVTSSLTFEHPVRER